jgi:hypothetical protein
LILDPALTCAPQTDAALWPALFTAIGSPSALLQHLLDSGALMAAGGWRAAAQGAGAGQPSTAAFGCCPSPCAAQHSVH